MSILNALKNHMEDNKISQTAISRAIGKSTAVISQYLQGKYQGDVPALEMAIESYLCRQAERVSESRSKLPFVETRTAKNILEFLRLAHIDGEIQVIYGAAGLGKTQAIKTYTLRNPDVLLIETDTTFTARVVLEELCVKLNVSTQGNMHELLESCVMKLRDSGRLIIVDEAELLPYRALEVLRRLHDKTGVGLVLAGMDRLLINLKGKRGEFAQLHSRVGFALNLGRALPQADIEAIAGASIDNVQPLSDVFYAESKGNARRLSKLVKRTLRMSVINNCPPDKKMIEAVSHMLIN